MTTNCYIIDTSSLVRLNRENPLDVYPSVWKKLELLISHGRLAAPKEVLNEISKSDDLLCHWAKAQNGLFIEPTAKQIEFVQDILSKYPSLINVDREFDADPWVIALALEMANSQQQRLVVVKRIVVTEEKLRGDRKKIPFVCQSYSIEAIDVITLFRTEGWTF